MSRVRVSRLAVTALVMLAPLVRDAAAEDESDPPPPGRHMALVAELRGGLMLVDPAGDDGVRPGALAGLAFRGLIDNLVDHRFGVAFGGDFELGYAASELQGQARVGVGVGGLFGPLSASVLAGGSLGSLGPAGSSDLFVEANASFTVDRRVGVWLLAAHAFSQTIDHDRLELRLALPKWSDGSGASTVIGVRMLVFGTDAMTRERAGTAYLVTVGWGAMQSEPGYIDPRFF
jgi:hypothetical protein